MEGLCKKMLSIKSPFAIKKENKNKRNPKHTCLKSIS